MKEYSVVVEKLTDERVMREACESTFLGKSKMSLLDIYKSEHSPARTQMFWIKMHDIPLASATHLIRHHVGSVPFQLSCRADRKGGNPGVPEKCAAIVESLKSALPSNGNVIADAAIATSIEQVEWLAENSDRNTPVNLSLFINAQALIDMAKLRLCCQASPETRWLFAKIQDGVATVDQALAKMMVRKCVYRGGICGEPRCCGFNQSSLFKEELKKYLSLFDETQYTH